MTLGLCAQQPYDEMPWQKIDLWFKFYALEHPAESTSPNGHPDPETRFYNRRKRHPRVDPR